MIKVVLFGLILLLTACGGAKDALTGKKKSATDEFLVEKKNPLVMPPDFGKLPMPTTDESNNNKKEDSVDEIKELLSNKDNVSVKNNQTKSTSLEKSILEKIK
ncbi:DUF3035 domain-containing protein [Pelagibacterales bacterium SAG-MED43]|nr:DUF3035 domain-containing protein [Pelagibacterales bacterium SAG-MED43]